MDARKQPVYKNAMGEEHVGFRFIRKNGSESVEAPHGARIGNSIVALINFKVKASHPARYKEFERVLLDTGEVVYKETDD